ncbi:MAG: hypothetical protein AAB557_04400 [Patescibacteria group bacterium]
MDEERVGKGNPVPKDAPIHRLQGAGIPVDIKKLLEASVESQLPSEDVQKIKAYIATRAGDESLQARALRFIEKHKFSGLDQAVASESDVHERRPAMEEGGRKVPLTIGEYELSVCRYLDTNMHDPSLMKGKKRWRVHSSDKPLTITQLDYPVMQDLFNEFTSHIVIANSGEKHIDWQPDYEGILGSFRRTYHGDHGWKELFLRPYPGEEDLYNSFGLRCISYTKENRIDLKFTYPDQSQFL